MKFLHLQSRLSSVEIYVSTYVFGSWVLHRLVIRLQDLRPSPDHTHDSPLRSVSGEFHSGRCFSPVVPHLGLSSRGVSPTRLGPNVRTLEGLTCLQHLLRPTSGSSSKASPEGPLLSHSGLPTFGTTFLLGLVGSFLVHVEGLPGCSVRSLLLVCSSPRHEKVPGLPSQVPPPDRTPTPLSTRHEHKERGPVTLRVIGKGGGWRSM